MTFRIKLIFTVRLSDPVTLVYRARFTLQFVFELRDPTREASLTSFSGIKRNPGYEVGTKHGRHECRAAEEQVVVIESD